MIPLLSAEQLREADRRTIAEEPVASVDLMERAAAACTEQLLARFPPEVPFVVLAGLGNNGGDGLAIARRLSAQGRMARVLVLLHRPTGSPDFLLQRERTRAAGVPIEELKDGQDLPELAGNEVVIDALFGTGLDRPLTGWTALIVRSLNAQPNPIVAIDLPSGLLADGEGDPAGAIVRARMTLTFQAPKLAFVLPGNERYVGEWTVLPIGLSPAYLASVKATFLLTEPIDAARLLPPRPRSGHKGTFGHAWLLAGSRGKMGAAILSARACLRSGPGLISVHVPGGHEALMHIAVPEAILSSDTDTDHLQQLPAFERANAIGIGPGLGTAEATARMLKLLIQQAPVPPVLDADALNILAVNRTWLAFLPKGSILTPHPKEFDRLTEASHSGHERLMRARELALRFGVVVVLKGEHTAVCTPAGQVHINGTGNPGMAKGGSGDALTGIITGLRAQGVPPVEAAVLGVHAHGLAGDIAAAERGMDGMTVSDLIERLPEAWLRLRALV